MGPHTANFCKTGSGNSNFCPEMYTDRRWLADPHKAVAIDLIYNRSRRVTNFAKNWGLFATDA